MLVKKTDIAAASQVTGEALRAKNLFQMNCDTLVAGFLIRHPDVDPATIELVFVPSRDGTMKFSIQPRELFVPIERPDPVRADYDDGNPEQDAAEFDRQMAYTQGYNAARAEMIRLIQLRPDDAMVAPLDLGADPLEAMGEDGTPS